MTYVHPLDTFNRIFPNAVCLLWRDNVIHGETLLRTVPRGHNIMMSDASDALLGLWHVGIVKPITFKPSHSGAALLGLDVSQRGPHYGPPHAGNAGHWDWIVTMGYYTKPIDWRAQHDYKN